MAGTVGTQAWASDANRLQVTLGSVPGSLIISGVQVGSGSDYVAVTLMLSFIGAPGLYPVGINIGSTPGGSGTILISSGGTVTTWLTPLSGAAGSVTVQSLTSTRIRGRFAFVADPIVGSGPQESISNGSFDVALPAGFTAVPANNRGSTMNADLGGFLWKAATVVGLGDLGAGSLSFGGHTTSHSVNLVTASPAAIGDFPLGVASGMNLTVMQLGGTNAWGSGTGATGTVSFTQLSDGRAAGTFSGTLVPLGTTVGSLTITNGTFDVRIDGP